MKINWAERLRQQVHGLAESLGNLFVESFHYLALFAIGAVTAWAAVMEFLGMLENGHIKIDDILLLFIYLELGAMTALTDDELGDVGRLAIVAQRARMLRSAPRPPGDGIVFGDIEMRLSPPALRRGRVSVPLSRSEREVVRVLAANLGRPVSQAELERHACPGVPAHPGFLKAVVLRVRRKVEEIGGDPLLLRTVRGFGYILIA